MNYIVKLRFAAVEICVFVCSPSWHIWPTFIYSQQTCLLSWTFLLLLLRCCCYCCDGGDGGRYCYHSWILHRFLFSDKSLDPFDKTFTNIVEPIILCFFTWRFFFFFGTLILSEECWSRLTPCGFYFVRIGFCQTNNRNDNWKNFREWHRCRWICFGRIFFSLMNSSKTFESILLKNTRKIIQLWQKKLHFNETVCK